MIWERPERVEICRKSKDQHMSKEMSHQVGKSCIKDFKMRDFTSCYKKYINKLSMTKYQLLNNWKSTVMTIGIKEATF